MKKVFLTILFLAVVHSITSQVNCYIYPEGSGERKACEMCEKASGFKQGSREKQILFDKAIAIGPKFDWAYYQKSVAYFKRGFIIEGLELLNEAIKLKPLDYLTYRAIWYWEYKNYDLCIKDLETYYAMPKAYLQTTPGGEKDMRIILGLAYAKTGKLEKGIETITNCFKTYKENDDFGLADYHSLGMLYVMNKQYDKAIETLKKQLTVNKDLADTYYYLGLAYKGKGETEEASLWFQDAILKFKDPYRFYNRVAGFTVYLEDIEKEIH